MLHNTQIKHLSRCERGGYVCCERATRHRLTRTETETSGSKTHQLFGDNHEHEGDPVIQEVIQKYCVPEEVPSGVVVEAHADHGAQCGDHRPTENNC